MPRFDPFPGLRYGAPVPLDRVIAPPYDVVGPDERAVLAARHPANAIHVELPVADGGLDPYTHAARLLESWTSDGTLERDRTPAFYAYRMTGPSGRSTTGVIGALGLEGAGGDVLPHEQTIPKDRTDRLELLRATRANLSPIWGLSLTDGLSSALTFGSVPDGAALDDDGVRHELWKVDDPVRIEAVRGAVEASPVVLADGHHRYETALAFDAERRDGDQPPGAVMALVVELAQDQVTVGPIHRAVVGVPAGVDVVGAFAKWFDVDPEGAASDAALAPLADSGTPVLVYGDKAWRLRARPEAYEAAGSDLDASVVAMTVDAMGATTAHRHTWAEAMGDVRSGTADAAVLMRPVTVQQIATWARDRRRMPPKSTYFFPKPRTGMVYRTLP
jgi:uncharacterized protein (DUF1015 family)